MAFLGSKRDGNFPIECIEFFIRMCSSRKYLYSPHRGDWNFLAGGGGGGCIRPKNLKKCMKLKEARKGFSLL